MHRTKQVTQTTYSFANGQSGDQPTEAELSVLINQCGKMRMLSHRAVMIALLNSAEATDTGSALDWDAFQSAVQEFETIAKALHRFGASGKMPELGRLVEAHGAQLDKFLSAARKISDSTAEQRTAQLNSLADFVAGPLLATLNLIVSGISQDLEQLLESDRIRMGQSRQVIQETVSEIAQISQAVFMISVNASIEASRAGDQGRGFAILANEIRTLSQTSAKSVEALQEELKGFVA